jgi:hypothetical protein
MLTGDRVADEEGLSQAKFVEDEETVARGHETTGLVKPSDGLELGVGGPVIQGKEFIVAGRGVVILESGDGFTADNGEGRLAAMVGEEEVVGGGGAAPSAADRAATEEGFWGEADEDLPDDDLLREAAAGRRRSCVRHGRRLGFHRRNEKSCRAYLETTSWTWAGLSSVYMERIFFY